MCRGIGRDGKRLIKEGMRILTHCNAGALATVDVGTVMAPLRAARDAGRHFFVYASETRPRLQGSRLTAWEVGQEGIDHAVVVDGAAGIPLHRGGGGPGLVGGGRYGADRPPSQQNGSA